MTTYKQEVRKRRSDETGKYPHPWVGIITLTNEGERGHQLIADFVENIWMRFEATEKITVSQAFGTKEVKLFVSATTKRLVKELVDEAINRLKGGFERKGESFQESK